MTPQTIYSLNLGTLPNDIDSKALSQILATEIFTDSHLEHILSSAASKGDAQIVRQILSLGRLPWNRVEILAVDAITFDRIKILLLFLEYYPIDHDLAATAILNNRIEILRLLLTRGSDPNVDRGYILNYACIDQNLEAVNLLFEYGLSPELHHAKNPLDIAVEKNNIRLAKLLISHGIDVNYHKRQALKRAARNHYVDIYRFLFPLAEIPDSELIFYLFWAIRHRDVSIVNDILKLGVIDEEVIRTDSMFTQNLFASLKSQSPEMVNILKYYLPGLATLFKIKEIIL